MLSSLIASTATFKKCAPEKLAFIFLNAVDLCLTIFAASLGAQELNPIMRNMISSPYQIYAAKIAIPVFFAWLLPGKVLIPSIALLAFVVGWDIRQLLIYFF